MGSKARGGRSARRLRPGPAQAWRWGEMAERGARICQEAGASLVAGSIAAATAPGGAVAHRTIGEKRRGTVCARHAAITGGV